MKKHIAAVFIFLPHVVMSPFWFYTHYFKMYGVSWRLALCQIIYGGLIGPLAIGAYGMWRLINQEGNIRQLSLFCFSLAVLGVFAGYANWGLSTRNFLNPDQETIGMAILEGQVATVIVIVIVMLMLLVGWLIARKKKELPNNAIETDAN